MSTNANKIIENLTFERAISIISGGFDLEDKGIKADYLRGLSDADKESIMNACLELVASSDVALSTDDPRIIESDRADAEAKRVAAEAEAVEAAAEAEAKRIAEEAERKEAEDARKEAEEAQRVADAAAAEEAQRIAAAHNERDQMLADMGIVGEEPKDVEDDDTDSEDVAEPPVKAANEPAKVAEPAAATPVTLCFDANVTDSQMKAIVGHLYKLGARHIHVSVNMSD